MDSDLPALAQAAFEEWRQSREYTPEFVASRRRDWVTGYLWCWSSIAAAVDDPDEDLEDGNAATQAQRSHPTLHEETGDAVANT